MTDPGTMVFDGLSTVTFRGKEGGVFHDTAEHFALSARTLRISPQIWASVIHDYLDRPFTEERSVDATVSALHASYARMIPDGSPLNGDTPIKRCPICLAGGIFPRYARRRGRGTGSAADFLYGCCENCRHGLLLEGLAPESIYCGSGYYEEQNQEGAGYRSYMAERAYRVEKGRRLLARIRAVAQYPPRCMLEVGSAFGFTRFAAEEAGLQTMGIDVNPFAAEAASRLFGMETFVGPLGAAVANGALPRQSWDLVLYDFVLEHVADPATELRLAARLLAPYGLLVLIVPSMDAIEVDVFGGTYRSFRSDHFHVFSARSLTLLLHQASLVVRTASTSCTAHLLKGFLNDEALRAVYECGRGPDLTVFATHGE